MRPGYAVCGSAGFDLTSDLALIRGPEVFVHEQKLTADEISRFVVHLINRGLFGTPIFYMWYIQCISIFLDIIYSSVLLHILGLVSFICISGATHSIIIACVFMCVIYVALCHFSRFVCMIICLYKWTAINYLIWYDIWIIHMYIVSLSRWSDCWIRFYPSLNYYGHHFIRFLWFLLLYS